MIISKKEQILRLLRATGSLQTLKMMFENQKIFNKENSDMYDQLESFMIDNGFIDNIADAYGGYFSEDEMDEAIQFYESGVGKKFVTIMPEVNKKLQPVMMDVALRFIAEVLESEDTSAEEV